MTFEQDLEAAADEEIERACTLGWRELRALTPWGDTYEGFTPSGREVMFDRAYLWADAVGGDIRVEVTVYEAQMYERGVTRFRILSRAV